jgi:transposase-like protein
MPKRKRRKRYSEQMKATILGAAEKEGLTAADVQKRFGVVAVTYYSWRKKAKQSGRGSSSSSSALRQKVREKLARQLPRLVEEEVDRFLKEAFGRS